MKREVFIGIGTAVLCLAAVVCGRAYQHARSALPPPLASPTSVAIQASVPTDFGRVLYRDLANISFADLYETIRDAAPQSRVEWLNEIEQTSESQRKVAALCAFFRALVQSDPQMAADLVINLPRHRGPSMDAMIAAAPPSAMPILAEMLLKVPREARNFGLTDHLQVVMDEWAQIDPEAVALFLDHHKDLELEQYADAFLETWAGLDHDTAWKWLQSRFGDAKESKLEPWLRGWFSADQGSAVAFALEHVDDVHFGEALAGLAPDLFEISESRAKEFLDKLPPGDVRQSALSGIASLATDFASDYSPETTAKFIVQFPASEWPPQLSSVFERWFQLRSTELLNWIQALPPDVQKSVVENFPEPMWDKPEPDLLPVLDMPQSELRTSLLRRLVAGLQKKVSELRLPDKYKTEIADLVSKDNED
jgi:hypothetical protein